MLLKIVYLFYLSSKILIIAVENNLVLILNNKHKYQCFATWEIIKTLSFLKRFLKKITILLTITFLHIGPVWSSSVTPSVIHPLPLPKLLTDKDQIKYMKIFSLQRAGRWQKADRVIRNLENNLLLGHVESQRYLHPTKYRSRYKELAKWLRRYWDHPNAQRIFKLALRRKPHKRKGPKRPKLVVYPVSDIVNIIENSGYRPRKRTQRNIIRRVRQMTHRRHLTAATGYIKQTIVKKKLGTTGLDLAKTLIASGWFFYGNTTKAARLANMATKRSGRKLPYAHWIAGLAEYRLGHYRKAAEHFEKVANLKSVKGYDHAAAAFWAARANMTGGQPQKVIHWLQVASKNPRAFYGLIALRWLGKKSNFKWQSPKLTKNFLKVILDQSGGKRALALLQMGLNSRAEAELRLLIGAGNKKLIRALTALAEQERLPMVSFQAGAASLGDKEGLPLAALYPIPSWVPRGGFKIDRALIYAFIRQESAFNIRAKSYAGARGLMQLMPATAGFIAKKRFRGNRRYLLYDPQLNISLGQKYIRHLLSNDHIKGDLLLMAAAYNGGPGNLKKWQIRAEKGAYSDPLMFIESIPARETRIFIERVLSNLWLYRERLGEPSPSLDALAAGDKPLYISVRNIKKEIR